MASPYETLGLEYNAPLDEVKKAYRRLAKLHHPDKNPHNPRVAAAEFDKITQAYDSILNGTYTQDKDTVQHSHQAVVRLNFKAALSSVYEGIKVRAGNIVFNFPVGFSNQFVYTFFRNNNKYVIEPVFKEWPGIKVDRYDLFASMRVSKKDVQKGTRFHITNHPNPQPVYIIFPKDVKSGARVILNKQGLPQQDGVYGDLYVTVTFTGKPRMLKAFTLIFVVMFILYLTGPISL